MGIRSIIRHLKRFLSITCACTGKVLSDFSRWTLFALILTCSTSQAVMNPNKAARELGVPNHLMRKPLAKLLTESLGELDTINFRVPPRKLHVFPYYEVDSLEATSDSDAILNSLFLTMFRDLPPQRWLSYHNIFFGYDEGPIVWGLNRRGDTSQISSMFQVEQWSNDKFTIYLPPSFKREPRLKRFALLIALARVELQIQLVKNYGGWSVVHENFEKILWVGDIHTMTLMREVSSHFDADLLFHEISRLDGQETLERIELVALHHSLITGAGKDWADYLFSSRRELSADLQLPFLNLILHIMENIFDKAQADQWSEKSFEALMLRYRPALTKWWRGLEQNRLRVLHESHTHKDTSLENVILSESIVSGNCDVVLKSMGPGKDDQVH